MEKEILYKPELCVRGESNHGLVAATHPRQPNENEILRVRHSRSRCQSMLMHARRPLNQSPAHGATQTASPSPARPGGA